MTGPLKFTLDGFADIAATIPRLLGFTPEVGAAVAIFSTGKRVALTVHLRPDQDPLAGLEYAVGVAIANANADRVMLAVYEPVLRGQGALMQELRVAAHTRGLPVTAMLSIVKGTVACYDDDKAPVPITADSLAQVNMVAAGMDSGNRSRADLLALIEHDPSLPTPSGFAHVGARDEAIRAAVRGKHLNALAQFRAAGPDHPALGDLGAVAAAHCMNEQTNLTFLVPEINDRVLASQEQNRMLLLLSTAVESGLPADVIRRSLLAEHHTT